MSRKTRPSVIPPANRRMSSKYDMYDERVRELDDLLLDRQQENIIQQMIEMGEMDEFNTGGRVGMQTGGLTPQQQYQDAVAALQESQAALPSDSISVQQTAPQIEGLLAAFGPQLATNLANPINAMGGVNQYGQAYGSFMPQMQGQNLLQQQAISSALGQAGITGTAQFGPGGQFTGIADQGTGLAGYQPFLNQAATDLTAASAAAAAGQGAGAGALGQAGTAMDAAQAAAAAGQDAGAPFMGPTAYQQFMSPYQQDVIDASLAQFDENAAQQAAQAGLTAAQAGAFGGGRFGVQEGQRQAQSNLDRASLQAGLLSQGYQQAQQQANTAFGQANQQAMQNMNMYGQVGQGQLAQAAGLQGQAGQNVGLFGQTGQGQQGLAALQPQLASQNIGMLGTLGAQQQQQGQAALDTAAQGNQMVAYQPQQGLGFFGNQLTGLMGGYGTGTTFSSLPDQPPASPMSMLMSGIGAGASVGNLFGGWGGG
tara:strand:+ start:109 stop:1554 length:1446 start_codon:yes stop_codon:yes gene_type:complete